jgi:hypothetical protein
MERTFHVYLMASRSGVLCDQQPAKPRMLVWGSNQTSWVTLHFASVFSRGFEVPAPVPRRAIPLPTLSSSTLYRVVRMIYIE